MPPTEDITSTIGYSMALMVCSSLLAEVGAALYGLIVGYNLQQKEVHRAVSSVMWTVGVLAVVLAVLGIASPVWLKLKADNQTFGLWQWCVTILDAPRKCLSLTGNEFVEQFKKAIEYRVAQALAIVGAVVLAISVLLSLLTTCILKQNVIVKVVVLALYILAGVLLLATIIDYFATMLKVTEDYKVNFSVAMMTFSAVATGVAAVFEAVLLGDLMAASGCFA
ncbi:unnamed protein product [Rotaria sordida]|uniref:Uncharacterized protein n=1 Tax=Rotaria sordida TaxID=392033 RepID=A0A816APH1_9BILA|nr:unnamed protein product [Rotaria sordida]CAF1599051.1 unnamed protein product [Rotaria sordida]